MQNKGCEMACRYWITTQWPASVDQRARKRRVYLPDDRAAAGEKFAKGDRIIMYESRTGRRRIGSTVQGTSQGAIPRNVGREGVVEILEAQSSFVKDRRIPRERYSDGTSIWWCWYADVEVVNRSGFVSRKRLNQLLGHKPGNRFRAYGTLHSGLKQIDETTYRAIVDAFTSHASAGLDAKQVVRENRKRKWGRGRGGEGPEHRALKMLVFRDPSSILGMPGLRGIETEFEFLSNDRMDVLLEDDSGRPFAVEVKVHIGSGDLAGVLQAIKYRHMYAVMSRRSFDEVGAVLVAHSISKDVLGIAKQYGVHCVVVPRDQ